MEIYVYDNKLFRKGTIENHTSLQWHRKYYDCGTFELHCPITQENLRLLQPGNIIAIKDKKEAAIIRGDQTEEESNLVNEIVRTGYFLPIIINDRLTGPLLNFTGTAEEGIRTLLGRATAIPLLEIASGTGDQTEVTFQATYKKMLTYISKLARIAEVGIRIRPDFQAKKLVFETYKGIDRTQKQGENTRVVFSEKYNNLNHAKHTYSDAKYVTSLVIGGPGEGENRTYVTIGGGSGFGLREDFLDAKEVSKDGLTDEEHLEALKAKGMEYLKEHAEIEGFEAEAEPDVNFIYGKDYDLGDKVTIQKKSWNTRHDLRITEICEVYEYGGMYVVPTFGDALPETIKLDE